ncbi:SET and MYND domain-containing protein DDB_G0273589-like [Microplitis mediator]|uniref:SET and MYND domain-containing protein DDB_G0273589-like n=1 Tax=Microplitis mediator TaxID=375433 RepID=UPI0025570B7D|nr:SET and MYND domain-containing protein DDB_G0273589-like [Microplitis mediator]
MESLSHLVKSLAVNDFQHAKSDEDFVKTAMTLCQSYYNKNNCQVLTINHESKSDSLAKDMINAGNKMANSNRSLEQSIEIYNEAMAHALPGSEFLAHAFANRSIVLTKAGMYEESLKDIQHALDANYPDNLKAGLYARKAKNLLALDLTANVEETLAAARSWALKLDDDKRDEFLSNLDKLKNKKYKKPVTQRDNRIYIPTAPDDNPTLMRTSGAVSINYSDKFGRHLIATRDIKAGEALMVKKVYLLVLVSEFRFKRCWNCSKHCWSSVPCNECANVIYCSEVCREIAWNEHHSLECPLLTALLTNKSYNCSLIMSLRLLVKALKEFKTVEELHKKIQEIDSVKTVKCFNGVVYDDTKYASVYSLFRKPLDTEFKVDSAMKTVMTIRYLSATTDVFGKKTNNFKELMENNWILFIGKLLFRHYEINATNTIAIELSDKKDENKTVICGGILVPLVDLCSHSCDRNTYSISSRDIFSLVCIQPIKKGEQIYVSYGEDYRDLETSERRKRLKENHGFWCECYPCVNNWGPHQNLPSCLDSLTNKKRIELLEVMTKCTNYYSIGSLGDGTSDKILKILSDLFAMINTFDDVTYYLCDEMDDIKVLLLCVLKLINSCQT